jgi:hypothetical protein
MPQDHEDRLMLEYGILCSISLFYCAMLETGRLNSSFLIIYHLFMIGITSKSDCEWWGLVDTFRTHRERRIEILSLPYNHLIKQAA